MLRTRLIAGRTSGLILAAVFASIVTLASQVEVVLEPLRVDPARPAAVTLRIPSNYLPKASTRTHRGLPRPLVVRPEYGTRQRVRNSRPYVVMATG